MESTWFNFTIPFKRVYYFFARFRRKHIFTKKDKKIKAVLVELILLSSLGVHVASLIGSWKRFLDNDDVLRRLERWLEAERKDSEKFFANPNKNELKVINEILEIIEKYQEKSDGTNTIERTEHNLLILSWCKSKLEREEVERGSAMRDEKLKFLLNEHKEEKEIV